MIKFDNTFNAGHLIIFVSSIMSFGSFYALTTYKVDTLASVVAELSKNYLSTAIMSTRLEERLRAIENRLGHIEGIRRP